MQPERIMGVVLRQYYLMRGSLTRLIPMFVWVSIDIVLWGFISRYLNQSGVPGADFVPTLLGAVLLWDFLVRVMHGTTMAFMEDTWSRNLLNIFATPMTVGEYVTGLVITSIGTSMIALVAMILLAVLVFGLSVAAYGAMTVPFLLVLFLFAIALGIFGCAIMLRLGPAAEWFIWPIPAIISPFACVFYPMSTLPHWMQLVAQLLPPSYVFEGMRAVVAGQQVASGTLLTGTVLAAGYILLACWTFARIHRIAVRTGLIARYSAETVS